jgi:hypothetical protein
MLRKSSLIFTVALLLLSVAAHAPTEKTEKKDKFPSFFGLQF